MWRLAPQRQLDFTTTLNTVALSSSHEYCVVCGGRTLLVLSLQQGSYEIVQRFITESKTENLTCAEFVYDKETTYTVLSGTDRIVYVVDVSECVLRRTLSVHGGTIHQIKRYECEPSTFFTASEDLSIKMFNTNGVCLAVFGGPYGHTDHVLTIDVENDVLVSGSVDNTIKAWRVVYSHQRPVLNYFPLFSSNEVHSSYVDHVELCNGFVASKASRITVFRPVFDESPSTMRSHESITEYVKKLNVSMEAGQRFSVYGSFLCTGTSDGGLVVWNMKTDDLEVLETDGRTIIKSVALSAKFIVAVRTDGQILYYTKEE